MDTLIRIIDTVNTTIGRWNSYLVLPLVGVVFYEVLMRYAFNAPTVWGFELTAFIYGIHFMLGLALTEKEEGHVKVEIMTSHFSRKGRAIFNIITYSLLFAPVFFFMAWGAISYGWTSAAMLELNSTSWAPPIWPLKGIMGLGFTMLFLQGISTLLKNIQILRGAA
ncbi:TRAP transporter small permease subunit [Desulfogranum mediterraneum]|uniref:TRAP transporter small permease subunit n=1 Tax=Desulfogranum mediterraneum TaxID=160661 RepID=UPI0003F9338A|nr:TRAP transporter small permease subunit [Desulfogranum mediterraneum]